MEAAENKRGPTRITVELPKLFNAELGLHHVKTSSFGAPCRFADDRRVSRLFGLKDGPAVVEFAFLGEPAVALEVSILGAGPSSTAAELRELTSTVWGLGDDLDACYAKFSNDPILAPLTQRFAGLRLVRGPDLYESLLVAVLGQQVSVASAQSIRRRLMADLGDRAEVDGFLYTGYPPASRLLTMSADDLRAFGVSRQKSKYIKAVAEWAVEGRLSSDVFAAMDDAAAIARLMEIPGVGRWTAEVALMRGLGRLDAFPAADLGLQVAVQRALEASERPSEKTLRAISETWTGWRSYATFYLWMSLSVKGYA